MLAPRIQIRTLLAAALLAVAMGTMLAAAPAASAARACQSTRAMPAQTSKRALVRATLCLLNAQRAQRRMRPLKLNRRLSAAARGHARDMARHEYFSHTAPSGSTFLDRIREAGYLRGARRWKVGENLAWGSGRRSAPRANVRAWMHSPGHRRNVLTRRFRHIGIGIVYDAPAPGVGFPAATYATTFGARR